MSQQRLTFSVILLPLFIISLPMALLIIHVWRFSYHQSKYIRKFTRTLILPILNWTRRWISYLPKHLGCCPLHCPFPWHFLLESPSRWCWGRQVNVTVLLYWKFAPFRYPCHGVPGSPQSMTVKHKNGKHLILSSACFGFLRICFLLNLL